MSEQQQLAPPDQFDSAVSQVAKNTTALMPLWMNNWASNLQTARYGDSLDKLYEKPPSEKCLIVGRGPSLLKRGHLDVLASKGYDGKIIASDGALPLLAEKGIVPAYSVTVDGSDKIAQWFTNPATQRIGSKVRAVLPMTVHKKTVDAVQDIGGHIYWYIPILDSEEIGKGITDALQLQTYSTKNQTGVSKMNGAGNAGMASIMLAVTILRAKEVALIGMDCGYLLDTPMAELHYHDGMMKSLGYNDKQVAELYRIYSSPLGLSVVDVVFETYRLIGLTLAQQMKSSGIRLVNCTEGGCLSSPDIEIMPFSDYLATSK